MEDKIDEVVGAELSSLGFERTRPRHWVEAIRTPIRSIFEFQAIKGGAYSARWGFSLDFVPLRRANDFQWKRTPKTAKFDLCIDPLDQHKMPLPDWFFIRRHEANDPIRLTAAAQESTRFAKLDFSRVSSIFDIVTIFRERATMQFRRFSLENYIQTDLAWGLSLIAIGDVPEGERHLELFCTRFSIDRNDRFLQQAEATAKSIASF
ncbi:MAG TPA: hypothetical protein VH206_10530 [Xanthobacteraceae bacterium]|nr:hypothetical protein [Xanthobacteraceae bacterium]